MRTFGTAWLVLALIGCSDDSSPDGEGGDDAQAGAPAGGASSGGSPDGGAAEGAGGGGGALPTESCDVLVVGASLGAVTAAHEAASAGARTCLVHDRRWLGGQLTEQAVPEDALTIAPLMSGTYDQIRHLTLAHYADHDLPSDVSQASMLTAAGQAKWNDYQTARSDGAVGLNTFEPGRCHRNMCFEPAVAAYSIEHDLLGPLTEGADPALRIFSGLTPVSVELDGTKLRAVGFDGQSGHLRVEAEVTIDATELGDLFPLIWPSHDPDEGYYVGRDGYDRFHEPEEAGHPAPDPECVQPFTFVLLVERRPTSEDNTIAAPTDYTALDTSAYFNPACYNDPGGCNDYDWKWRRTLGRDDGVDQDHGADFFDAATPDVSNWNFAGNDYSRSCLPIDGMPDGAGCNVIDKSPQLVAAILDRGRQHSLGMLYWVQTQASVPNPSVKLRADMLGWGTDAGTSIETSVSAHPYIRESRRLKAAHMITQQEALGMTLDDPNGVDPFQVSTHYVDSVGIGSYFFDLHPCATGEVQFSGDHAAGRHAQIPLGALVPETIDGLLAGAKNLGVTHITNGQYRIHPVEANVGQGAGAAAALAVERSIEVRDMIALADGSVADEAALRELQQRLLTTRPDMTGGSPLVWSTGDDTPRKTSATSVDPTWIALQGLDVAGIMQSDAPSSSLNRGQAATVVARVLGLAAPSCHPSFLDVPCDHTHYAGIQALADLEVVSGYADGTFLPGGGATRAQLVKMLVAGRCLDDASWCADEPPPTATFADVPVGSPFHAFIEVAAQKGLFADAALGDTFDPGGNAARRAAALFSYPVFLDRLGP